MRATIRHMNSWRNLIATIGITLGTNLLTHTLTFTHHINRHPRTLTHTVENNLPNFLFYWPEIIHQTSQKRAWVWCGFIFWLPSLFCSFFYSFCAWYVHYLQPNRFNLHWKKISSLFTRQDWAYYFCGCCWHVSFCIQIP